MLEGLELREWNEYVRLLVGLLALINPLTILPIFLVLLQGRAEQEKRHISMVASVTVLVTLLSFTYLGGALLGLFAITIESFRIAGGILLLLTALEMMRAKSTARAGGEDTEVNVTSIGIVPIGIPLLAGPGAIVTTIVDATALHSIAHKVGRQPGDRAGRARGLCRAAPVGEGRQVSQSHRHDGLQPRHGHHHRLDRDRVHPERPGGKVPGP